MQKVKVKHKKLIFIDFWDWDQTIQQLCFLHSQTKKKETQVLVMGLSENKENQRC